MTLTYYKDYQELFASCVLHWQGRDQTSLGFPILPAGVTVTPNGSWTDLTTGVTRSVKNFDGSTNYVSLSDNDAWNLFSNSFTIAFWFKTNTSGSHIIISHQQDSKNWWLLDYYTTTSILYITGKISNVTNFNYQITHSHVNDEWNHFAIVKSGTTPGTWIIYKNGVSQTVNISVEYTGSVFTLNAALNSMFRANLYYAGNIKDLMIWKGRALIQPEIIEIMRLTNPASGRDFAAIYPGVRSCE